MHTDVRVERVNWKIALYILTFSSLPFHKPKRLLIIGKFFIRANIITIHILQCKNCWWRKVVHCACVNWLWMWNYSEISNQPCFFELVCNSDEILKIPFNIALNLWSFEAFENLMSFIYYTRIFNENNEFWRVTLCQRNYRMFSLFFLATHTCCDMILELPCSCTYILFLLVWD